MSTGLEEGNEMRDEDLRNLFKSTNHFIDTDTHTGTDIEDMVSGGIVLHEATASQETHGGEGSENTDLKALT